MRSCSFVLMQYSDLRNVSNHKNFWKQLLISRHNLELLLTDSGLRNSARKPAHPFVFASHCLRRHFGGHNHQRGLACPTVDVSALFSLTCESDRSSGTAPLGRSTIRDIRDHGRSSTPFNSDSSTSISAADSSESAARSRGAGGVAYRDGL